MLTYLIFALIGTTVGERKLRGIHPWDEILLNRYTLHSTSHALACIKLSEQIGCSSLHAVTLLHY